MGFIRKLENSELELYPVATFDGDIVVIEEQDKHYFSAIKVLKKEKIIGFDTETKPSFVANGKRNGVALLQISTEKVAFLFRVAKLGLPSELKGILSSNKIIKVGVAVRDDIIGLQKISNFSPNSFIDLQSIIEKWGIEEKSLQKMAAVVVGERVSKSQRLSNWEAEPMSDGQLSYAAIDAWMPLRIYFKLMSL